MKTNQVMTGRAGLESRGYGLLCLCVVSLPLVRLSHSLEFVNL